MDCCNVVYTRLRLLNFYILNSSAASTLLKNLGPFKQCYVIVWNFIIVGGFCTENHTFTGPKYP